MASLVARVVSSGTACQGCAKSALSLRSIWIVWSVRIKGSLLVGVVWVVRSLLTVRRLLRRVLRLLVWIVSASVLTGLTAAEYISLMQQNERGISRTSILGCLVDC